MNNTNFNVDYDYNGAITYTVITILFYSLVLFCSLILNIDRYDYYYAEKYTGKIEESVDSKQADVLNILSDPVLRQKYWRIYYGDDEFEYRLHKIQSAEIKRLSNVSQRMKELTNERLKQTSKYEELDELQRIVTNRSPKTSHTPSPASILFKFRRSQSTSIPSISYSTDHRSCDTLCQTPVFKSSVNNSPQDS